MTVEFHVATIHTMLFFCDVTDKQINNKYKKIYRGYAINNTLIKKSGKDNVNISFYSQ